jgi:hypothetical protein
VPHEHHEHVEHLGLRRDELAAAPAVRGGVSSSTNSPKRTCRGALMNRPGITERRRDRPPISRRPDLRPTARRRTARPPAIRRRRVPHPAAGPKRRAARNPAAARVDEMPEEGHGVAGGRRADSPNRRRSTTLRSKGCRTARIRRSCELRPRRCSGSTSPLDSDRRGRPRFSKYRRHDTKPVLSKAPPLPAPPAATVPPDGDGSSPPRPPAPPPPRTLVRRPPRGHPLRSRLPTPALPFPIGRGSSFRRATRKRENQRDGRPEPHSTLPLFVSPWRRMARVTTTNLKTSGYLHGRISSTKRIAGYAHSLCRAHAVHDR